jgi:hypothetical protein
LCHERLGHGWVRQDPVARSLRPAHRGQICPALATRGGERHQPERSAPPRDPRSADRRPLQHRRSRQSWLQGPALARPTRLDWWCPARRSTAHASCAPASPSSTRSLIHGRSCRSRCACRSRPGNANSGRRKDGMSGVAAVCGLWLWTGTRITVLLIIAVIDHSHRLYLVPHPALDRRVKIRNHSLFVKLGCASARGNRLARGVGARGEGLVIYPRLDAAAPPGSVDQTDWGGVVAQFVDQAFTEVVARRRKGK